MIEHDARVLSASTLTNNPVVNARGELVGVVSTSLGGRTMATSTRLLAPLLDPAAGAMRVVRRGGPDGRDVTVRARLWDPRGVARSCRLLLYDAFKVPPRGGGDPLRVGQPVRVSFTQ